jgi:hypothetical protein
MSRPTYVCTACSEHFARKYSAKRHNHNIPNNGAEIVRLIDYLADRASGRYLASHPFWYKRNERSVQSHKIGSATVADTVGDTFRPRYSPQQAPLRVSQYSTSPILRIVDDQKYGTRLSQQTILKIERLKQLCCTIHLFLRTLSIRLHLHSNKHVIQ